MTTVESHRAAFEYDWRTRFGLPLTVVGERMTYGEAIRLTKLLRKDPASQVAAALENWENPISREALFMLDQFDLLMNVHSKKRPKPHGGRPWEQDKTTRRKGNVDGLDQAKVRERLRAMGHNV